MTAFVEYCVWFLCLCSVGELAWKGYKKYKELKKVDK
jgi:hypothetical protein